MLVNHSDPGHLRNVCFNADNKGYARWPTAYEGSSAIAFTDNVVH
jgi:hypothetical protein